MTRTLVLAAFVALLPSTIGCMGFRDADLVDPSLWPPRPETAPKSTIQVSVQLTLITYDRKPQQMTPTHTKSWVEDVRRDFQSSGLFSSVSPDAPSSDLSAEVDYVWRTSGSEIWSIVSVFSFGIIPGRETWTLASTTTFKDRTGIVRGSISRQRSLTVWCQILLLFGMPFSHPESELYSTKTDMNRSTLLEAADKGYLRP